MEFNILDPISAALSTKHSSANLISPIFNFITPTVLNLSAFCNYNEENVKSAILVFSRNIFFYLVARGYVKMSQTDKKVDAAVNHDHKWAHSFFFGNSENMICYTLTVLAQPLALVLLSISYVKSF